MLELHRLDPLGLAKADPVDRGWAYRIHRGPRTIQEVLRAASAAMDEQDKREAYERDPLLWLAAQRRKHSLWARLTGRR